MPLVEKAYAQWNETGREGRDGQNAYASLNGRLDAERRCAGPWAPTATTYYPAGDPTAEQAVIAAICRAARR